MLKKFTIRSIKLLIVVVWGGVILMILDATGPALTQTIAQFIQTETSDSSETHLSAQEQGLEPSELAIHAATTTLASPAADSNSQNAASEIAEHTTQRTNQEPAAAVTVSQLETSQQEAGKLDQPEASLQSPASTVLPVVPPAIRLTGFSHEWQTWNNCGPATLAMNLSFFGSSLNQSDIGAILRQHEDDKNVSPEELVAFALSQGYGGQIRVNGNSTLLKNLIANGVPVLIETWLEPDQEGGLGHYRLLTGYDDEAQHWIAFDSYISQNLVSNGENYEGIVLPYAEADNLWRVFNRTYLLIYSESKTEVVHAILGDQLDSQNMWSQALFDVRAEVAREPHDPFVWFNLGSTLTEHRLYYEAAIAFDKARQLGLPWRMMWYQFGPFKAYYETQRYADVLDLAAYVMAGTESIEEVYYWQGRAYAALGDADSARSAWQRALSLNPTYEDAVNALASLE